MSFRFPCQSSLGMPDLVFESRGWTGSYSEFIVTGDPRGIHNREVRPTSKNSTPKYGSRVVSRTVYRPELEHQNLTYLVSSWSTTPIFVFNTRTGNYLNVTPPFCLPSSTSSFVSLLFSKPESPRPTNPDRPFGDSSQNFLFILKMVFLKRIY